MRRDQGVSAFALEIIHNNDNTTRRLSETPSYYFLRVSPTILSKYLPGEDRGPEAKMCKAETATYRVRAPAMFHIEAN